MGSPLEHQLLLFERYDADDKLVRSFLARADGVCWLVEAGKRRRLPPGAVEAVMRRYARPLEDGVVVDGPALDLGGGLSLARLQFRALYDVLPKDYLVLEAEGEPRLCELCTAVVAALNHLATALEDRAG